MKIKMIKGPRPGQSDMVCMTTNGTYAVKIGETIDVTDTAGQEILSQWGSCFQLGTVEVEPKVVKIYKNKSVTSGEFVPENKVNF